MKTASASFKSEINKTANGKIQLLPAGYFAANDGRPDDVPGKQWLLNQALAEQVILQASKQKNAMVVDYEHQSQLSLANGQPAPAAGWIKQDSLEWVEGVGLFAKIEWTDKAKGFLDGGEYRFISANIQYNPKNGNVLSIHGAGLTNNPAIDGMKPVTSLSAKTIGKELFSPLCALLNSLGVNVGDTISTAEMEQATSQIVKPETSKVPVSDKATATLTAKLEVLETELAELKAIKGSFDALTSEREKEKLESLIQECLSDGRLIAREEQSNREFASKYGYAALKSLLDKRPVIEALTGRQTDAMERPDKLSKRLNRSQQEQDILAACGFDKFTDEE